MEAIYWLAWFWIFGILLVWLLKLLTEKAEVQIFTGLTSMILWYLMINILSLNILFTWSLILGWLLITISWINKIR